jgi:hypothetical protein
MDIGIGCLVYFNLEKYPDINFMGLLIGPRGNTMKKLEKDTGAKVMIRGKGTVKEGKGITFSEALFYFIEIVLEVVAMVCLWMGKTNPCTHSSPHPHRRR